MIFMILIYYGIGCITCCMENCKRIFINHKISSYTAYVVINIVISVGRLFAHSRAHAGIRVLGKTNTQNNGFKTKRLDLLDFVTLFENIGSDTHRCVRYQKQISLWNRCLLK